MALHEDCQNIYDYILLMSDIMESDEEFGTPPPPSCKEDFGIGEEHEVRKANFNFNGEKKNTMNCDYLSVCFIAFQH